MKNIISVIQPCYICRDVFLFISDFGAAGLKANKDLPKISLVLRRPTHLTLKIICYHNIVKNVSHFTNFSANFCLVSEKAFTLHHFLTPKKCILKALWEKRKENFCFTDEVRFYLIRGGLEGRLNNILKTAHCLGLVNFFQFFVLIGIFGNSTIFRYFDPVSIALKRWKFQDNVHFKGKIVPKFLIWSHFLSI